MDTFVNKSLVGPLRGRVKVESTGLQGGDAGHGGRTTITISVPDGSFVFDGKEHTLTVVADGDWELCAITQAFRIVTKALKEAVRAT